MKQIIYKTHRIQVLETEGHARVKQANKCSNCLMEGRSIRTCQDKCMYCDSVCFVHLQKNVENNWVRTCRLDETMNYNDCTICSQIGQTHIMCTDINDIIYCRHLVKHSSENYPNCHHLIEL